MNMENYKYDVIMDFWRAFCLFQLFFRCLEGRSTLLKACENVKSFLIFLALFLQVCKCVIDELDESATLTCGHILHWYLRGPPPFTWWWSGRPPSPPTWGYNRNMMMMVEVIIINCHHHHYYLRCIDGLGHNEAAG